VQSLPQSGIFVARLGPLSGDQFRQRFRQRILPNEDFALCTPEPIHVQDLLIIPPPANGGRFMGRWRLRFEIRAFGTLHSVHHFLHDMHVKEPPEFAANLLERPNMSEPKTLIKMDALLAVFGHPCDQAVES